MRYTGEARFWFEGDKEKAMRLIPRARALLGVLLNDAAFNDLQVATRRYRFDGGVTIEVSKRFGLMGIAIYVPVAEPVVEVAAEEEFELVQIADLSIAPHLYALLKHDKDGNFTGVEPLSDSQMKGYLERTIFIGSFGSFSDNRNAVLLYGDKISLNGNDIYEVEEDEQIIDVCLVNGVVRGAIMVQGTYLKVIEISDGSVTTAFEVTGRPRIYGFGDDGVFNFVTRKPGDSLLDIVYKDSSVVFEEVYGPEGDSETIRVSGMDRNGNLSIAHYQRFSETEHYHDEYPELTAEDFENGFSYWWWWTATINTRVINSSVMDRNSTVVNKRYDVQQAYDDNIISEMPDYPYKMYYPDSSSESVNRYDVTRYHLGSSILRHTAGDSPLLIGIDNSFPGTYTESFVVDGTELAAQTTPVTLWTGNYFSPFIPSSGGSNNAAFDHFGGYFFVDTITYERVWYKSKVNDVIDHGYVPYLSWLMPSVIGLLLKRQTK